MIDAPFGGMIATVTVEPGGAEMVPLPPMGFAGEFVTIGVCPVTSIVTRI